MSCTLQLKSAPHSCFSRVGGIFYAFTVKMYLFIYFREIDFPFFPISNLKSQKYCLPCSLTLEKIANTNVVTDTHGETQ